MDRKQRTHRMISLLVAVAILFALAAMPAMAADSKTPHDVKFSGVIEALGATSWTVAGQTLIIDAGTRIIPPNATPALGMWADVQARRQASGALVARIIKVYAPELRFKGEVSDIPEGRIGDWIIAGQTFAVNANTQIDERGGPIAEGSWVVVVAMQDTAGVKVALRIRSIAPLPAVEVHGAIQAASADSWTISGITLAVDADTLINGTPVVGLLAQGSAELQPDGSLLALRLKVLWHEAGQPQPPVTLTGAVEQLPPHGLNGRWVVAGTNVVVSRNTAINQENGLAVVGAQVEVTGWQAGANVIIAQQITVLSSPVPGGTPVRFTDRIEALPAGTLIGTWTVGENQVQVTDNTRILGERFARVGARATVRGLRLPTGDVYALWVTVRPSRPGEDGALPASE